MSKLKDGHAEKLLKERSLHLESMSKLKNNQSVAVAGYVEVAAGMIMEVRKGKEHLSTSKSNRSL